MTTRALIVDDSRTARVRMRRLLEGAEGGRFEVEEVVDGGEALELLANTPLDRRDSVRHQACCRQLVLARGQASRP